VTGLADPTARPATPSPEMNRQERVIFTVYVVMGLAAVVFLAVTGVLWWLEA
jgi:hypothetical protein